MKVLLNSFTLMVIHQATFSCAGLRPHRMAKLTNKLLQVEVVFQNLEYDNYNNEKVYLMFTLISLISKRKSGTYFDGIRRHTHWFFPSESNTI